MKKKLIYLTLVSLFLPHFLLGQWEHLGTGLPAPSSGKLSIWSLAAIDTHTIWAMPANPTTPSSAGTRLYSRTVDGGSTWVSDTVSHDPGYSNFNIFGLNADTAWANLGLLPNRNRSKIYRTNNGGTTWTEQTGPFNNLNHYLDNIHFFDSNIGICYGSSKTGTAVDSIRIYRTTNGGTTWTRIPPSTLPSPIGTEVLFVFTGNNSYDAMGDTLWFGSSIGRVWKSTDRGQTWNAYLTGINASISSIQFKNPMEGILVSSETATGAKTTNGGITWTPFFTPFPARFAEYVPGTTDSYLMACVYWPVAQFAITQNAGASWDSVHFAYPVYLNTLELLSPQAGFGGGWVDMPDSGGVYSWIGDLTAPGENCNSCSHSVNVFPDTEDFEGNGGKWCQDGNDELDWTLVNGPTRSTGTGPQGAFQDNYYLYLEASSPNFPNKSANLVSPCYDLDASCVTAAHLTFSYHMLGANMGELSVAVSTDSGQTWATPVWSVFGNQGNSWFSDSVNLSAYIGQTIRLRIRGTTGIEFASDIALDDISLNTTSVMQITPAITDVDCQGNSTGQIATSLAGGATPITYSWSTGDSTSTIQNLPAGAYQLTVSDANGCTTTEPFFITEPPLLQTSVTSQAIRCNGMATGSAMVQASGGAGNMYSYSWSTGDTTNSIQGLMAGIYSVTTTDANGCQVVDTVAITEPPALAANLSVADVDCFGDTNGMATLSPTGGSGTYNYTWSNGDITDSISNLAPGIYSYLVADGLGCVKNGTFRVNEPNEIDPMLNATDISCFGLADGSILAAPTGGNGGFSYNWSNGDTTDTNSGLGAGSYTVVITDSKGCTMGDSAIISEPPALVSMGTTTDESSTGVADGAIDLSLSGGTPPYASISWSNGATTEDLSGLSAGAYIVTVTDANGCVIMDTFEILTLVGIEGAFALPGFNMYPNPTHNELFVQYTLEKQGPVRIESFDLTGRKVLEVEGPAWTGTHIVRLDIESISPGTYLLVIENAHGKGYTRWVKEK